MKARMNADGTIVLVPETGAEAYALARWADDNWLACEDLARKESGCWRGSGLMIAHPQDIDGTQP